MKNILTAYKRGLICARYNWKLLLLLYLMNVLMMYLSVGPLSNLLKSGLSNSLETCWDEGGLDYEVLMDLLNQNSAGFEISFLHILAMFLPYLLWSIFSSGGIVEVTKNYSIRSSLHIFWQGAASYFFRFFRLTLYILIIYGVLIFFMGWFFIKDGLSPFDFDSEQVLINRFWILIGLFLFLSFFITTFRDLAKVLMRDNDEDLVVTKSLADAFKKTCTIKFFVLSLLNVLVLAGIAILYYFIKQWTQNYFIATIVAGQIFILFRLAYKIIRFSSFDQLKKLTTTAPPFHIGYAGDKV